VNEYDDLLIDCFLLIFQLIDNRHKHLKIQSRITKLVKYLYGKYQVDRDEIDVHLSHRFEARQRHLKYDPEKSPLETYVSYFVYYGLLNLLCECKRSGNIGNKVPLSELINGDSIATLGRPVESFEKPGIEALINTVTPEDQIIGKQLLEIALRHFGKTDLDVLLGISDRATTSRTLSMKYHSYCKRLNRKVENFRAVINLLGYEN